MNPVLGSRALAEIETSDVKRLYAKLRECGKKDSKDYGGRLSKSSVSKIYLVLSAVLESVLNEGLIISNPVKHKSVRAPGQSRRSRKTLEGDQILSRSQPKRAIYLDKSRQSHL